MLDGRALCHPGAVTKHQDVRPRQIAARKATRKLPLPMAYLVIHLGRNRLCRPDIYVAGAAALEMMDRAMHLADAFHIETRLLELAIDIAGKDKTAFRHPVGHSAKRGKPGMRHRLPVERQSVPVKPPGQARITAKVVRAGDLFERHASTTERRIGTPEALRTAKIRQPGIHPHAGSGSNQQPIGLTDERRCTFQVHVKPGCFVGWLKICCHWIAPPFRCFIRGNQRAPQALLSP